MRQTVESEKYLINQDIFGALCSNFYGLYIFDIDDNTVVPVKNPTSLDSFFNSDKLNWDECLSGFMDAFISEEYRSDVYKFLMRSSIRDLFTSMSSTQEIIYRQISGSWIKMVLHPMTMKNGHVSVLLGKLIDITKDKIWADNITAEWIAQKRRADNYTRLFFDSATEMYSRIIKFNLLQDTAVKITFENDRIVEYPVGTWSATYDKLIRDVHPDDLEDVISKTNKEVLLKAGPGCRIAFTYRSKMGGDEYRWFSTTFRFGLEAIEDKKTLVFTNADDSITPEYELNTTAFTIDVTDEMIEREKLLDLSEHDKLTDLFNRTKLERMIKAEYSKLDSCGVIFFDVNNLKTVNDTQGHEAGDKLLRLAAESIRSLANRFIHAYRLGGDEFMVVVCNDDEKKLTSLIDMWQTRLALISYQSGIFCTAAVGKAWAKSPIDIPELMKMADAAMYESKKKMKHGSANCR